MKDAKKISLTLKKSTISNFTATKLVGGNSISACGSGCGSTNCATSTCGCQSAGCQPPTGSYCKCL